MEYNTSEIHFEMPFYNRKRELALLDDLYVRAGGQMFVLYGRRRIGKTALLTHWLAQRGRGAIFWTADRTSPANQLRAFSQAIQAYAAPGETVPVEFTYASWDQAFNEIARLSRQ